MQQTLGYKTVSSNSESDLVAIEFPEELGIPKTQPSRKRLVDGVDLVCRSRFPNLGVTVIQCKTNWADNAQIPMLWDMVYSMKDSRASGVTVGTAKLSPDRLTHFAYAFATVPTQKDLKGKYKDSSLPVRRVSNLSGGNYWATESRSGVASSLDNLAHKNFTSLSSSPYREGSFPNVRLLRWSPFDCPRSWASLM